MLHQPRVRHRASRSGPADAAGEGCETRFDFTDRVTKLSTMKPRSFIQVSQFATGYLPPC